MSDHKAKAHSDHASSHDSHADEHKGLISTPKQLIVAAALALLVPVSVAYLAAQWATSGLHVDKAESEKHVLARIAPVGTIQKFDPNAAPPAPVAAVAPAADKPKSGEEVYATACAACHATGVAGAPKQGDKGGWAPRIAQGTATLYEHAIKGFQGKAGVMPAKGGNAALSDAEVKAAVDFMVAAAK